MQIGLATLVRTHPATSGAIGAWLIGNIAAALPSPDSSSGKLYKFAFAFMHGVGGSIPRIGATLFPQYAKYFGAAAVDTKSQPLPRPDSLQ
ncbi:MAG: hypothetical protein WAN10_12795 [Candidatus Acidiferrales bacterium]